MREQIAQQSPLKRRASAQRKTEYPASPHHAGLHPEDMPFQSSQLTRGHYPQADDEEELDDSYYPQRLPLSNRRYRSTDVQEIVRGNRRLVIHNEPPPSKKRLVHPLLFVGIVAAVIIAGVILLSQAEVWWTNQQNTWKYGYPRLYQTDAVVGHNDSATKPSHFIALNLQGHIEVIEFPGGDATKAKVYLAVQLFGDGDNLVPVTVSFTDVNGDGKPDMLIHLQDQTIIFLNSNGEFASANK